MAKQKKIFNSIIFSSSLVATCHSLQAKNLKINASAQLKSTVVSDKLAKTKKVGLSVLLDSKYIINNYLKSSAILGANLENGSHSSVYISEHAPDKEWKLNEAILNFSPIEFINIEAGAINQGHYNSPLLVSSSAFMGASEQVKLKFLESYSVSLKSQQAIPNNKNLADRVGNVHEGTPRLDIHSATIELGGDVLSTSLTYSLFKFSNLSSGVAYQSGFVGNSIFAGGTNNSRFAYDFEGSNIAGNFKWNYDGLFNLGANFQYLYNDKAPDSRNSGLLIKGFLEYSNFGVSFSHFKNESDSSPAYYNSGMYGHNNKEGLGTEVNYKLDNKTDLAFSWFQSEPILSNSFQSTSDTLSFSLKIDLI